MVGLEEIMLYFEHSIYLRCLLDILVEMLNRIYQSQKLK